MADEVLQIDPNQRNVGGGITDDASLEIVNFRINPSTKRLLVETQAGGGGGTASTDEDTFTAGTTDGTPIMGARDDAASDTIDEGDLGIVRITTNRGLHVNLRDASGNELGTPGSPVYTQGTITSISGVVLATGTATIGSIGAITSTVTITGNVGLSTGTNTVGSIGAITGSVVPGTAAANLGKAEDAGHTTADTGVMSLGVMNSALAALSDTTLDYTPIATENTGRVLVSVAPTAAMTRGTNSMTTAGSMSVVAAAGGSLKNYITDIQIANTGGTATLITFQDGNGGGAAALGFTIAPAGGGSNIHLTTPYVTSANTAFFVAVASASTTVYASAQAFKAP